MMWDDYSDRLQECYTRSFNEVRDTDKAAKDIVGANYEIFRAEQIKRFSGLDVATKEEAKVLHARLGGFYTPDQYILNRTTRALIAIEEDKGHYVDKCFAKRAIFNAAETFHHCITSHQPVPYFILSSPTSYDIHHLLRLQRTMFSTPVALELSRKFKAFFSCDHGRTSRDKYLKEEEMPFRVNNSLIGEEVRFFNILNNNAGKVSDAPHSPAMVSG